LYELQCIILFWFYICSKTGGNSGGAGEKEARPVSDTARQQKISAGDVR